MQKAACTMLLLATAATCALAQSSKESVPTVANPIVTTVRQMEERYSRNLIAAADEMPADKYSYHPTPAQITFGHLIVHVAQSNNALCAAVAGAEAHASTLSENDSRETLTRALKDSFVYCEEVLSKADDSILGQPATLSGGRTGTRGAALVHLAVDWADHYSAAAMYLRLNNLLPPSAHKSEGK